MLKGKNVGKVSGMKGSLSFVFSVVSWDMMRGIFWNLQTNKIPDNMVIGFGLKGMEKSKTTSSGDRDGGNEGRIEENTNTATKLSAAPVSNGGENHSGNAGNQKNSNEGSTEQYDVSVGDSSQDATRDSPVQTRQNATGNSVSREMGFFPPTDTPRDLGEIKGFEDALSLVGRQAHLEKEQMEMSSPMKCNARLNKDKRSSLDPTRKEIARKTKAEAN